MITRPRLRSVGVEKRGGLNLSPEPDGALVKPEFLRTFQPDAIDVDDLAMLIGRLLDSGDASGDPNAEVIPALHLASDRATHVMGSGGAEPS